MAIGAKDVEYPEYRIVSSSFITTPAVQASLPVGKSIMSITAEDLEKLQVEIQVLKAENEILRAGVEESRHVEDSPASRLVKQGKLVEAGAAVEGLARVVSLELVRNHSLKDNDTAYTLVWRLDNEKQLVQAMLPDGKLTKLTKLSVDFTKDGGDGELVAYVREKPYVDPE